MLLSIPSILSDVVVILALAIPVILVLYRVNLPSIVGFLVTGVIAGPYVLKLVTSQEHIDILAEIGVVLLLFTIGMEFSLPNLLRIRKAVFLAGSLQLVLTTTVFGAITYFGTYDYLPIAIFYGFLSTLSSTAIVLKLLQMRGEMGSPHGQIILAILIFQDIAVVPMMLMMPILAGQADNILQEVLLMIAKTAAVLAFLVLVSKFVLKPFLNLVVMTKSKELFISTIVVICFSVAYLTSLAGLSLALGAFLAGLVMSESDYAHEATGYILPFKEIFTSIFFISIGMLMDINFLWANLMEIILLTVMSMIIQAFLAFWAAKSLKVTAKTAILVGLSICQIGEFAFVLAKSGTEIGLMPIELYQYFLSTSVLTMAFAPILIINSKRISHFLIYRLPKPKFISNWATKRVRIPEFLEEFKDKNLEDHIVIIGFGYNGKTIAKAARLSNIPFIIIETDPRRVKKDSVYRKNILFGDAMNEEVQHGVNFKKARIVVITLTDLEITKVLTQKIKHYNSEVAVLVRNKRAKDVAGIEKAGADIVVTDELEANLELFTQALQYYYLPQREVYSLISKIREELIDE
ncbi:cation:proton antiporter [Bernardetia sp.]|uniref:cation:proton antiporter n=1 Tax=Bernardetia sp. TaxID=1937974 RepID=UPI0025C15C8E|nr:cation:proton antiporter [Bernardetia sp.]